MYLMSNKKTRDRFKKGEKMIIFTYYAFVFMDAVIWVNQCYKKIDKDSNFFGPEIYKYKYFTMLAMLILTASALLYQLKTKYHSAY